MVDIICVSTTDWDEIWGSRQQIMSRFAQQGNRVFFIERQVGPEHLLRDHQMRQKTIYSWKQSSPQEVRKNLWIIKPPLLLPGRYYSFTINRINQNILVKFFKHQTKVFSISKPVLWVYPPHSGPLVGCFNESLSVYHCIDRFLAGSKGRKRKVIEKQEKQLLDDVDIIFTHSSGIKSLFESISDKPINLIPSAADVEFLQSNHQIHAILKSIPAPRLGIVGTFDVRIDSDLILEIALSHPEWQLIMVGRIRPGFSNLKELKNLQNVHILGQYSFSELPLIMNGMDAFLAPYILSENTEYINPLKVYEYLAIGKPTICVSLPEIRYLNGLIEIASSRKEFISRISSALETDNELKQLERRKVSLEHSWDQRVDSMWNILQTEINKS